VKFDSRLIELTLFARAHLLLLAMASLSFCFHLSRPCNDSAYNIYLALFPALSIEKGYIYRSVQVVEAAVDVVLLVSSEGLLRVLCHFPRESRPTIERSSRGIG
jgi:hypothetical protein